MDDTEAAMVHSARQHGGQYLLRRVYTENQRDVDPLWQAAKRLVEQGKARWIPGYSSKSPGIELLGSTDPT